ncbi:54S ribosomal protein L3 mitochondrial, partial [Coemansia asiatica]
NPKTMLVELTKRKGLEYPIARLMKETGRFTSSPVFIVGVFCGTRMVGMGFGSSLKMAEYRAAKDALLKHYAKEIKDVQLVDADDSDLTFFKDSEATASASASAFAA